MKNLILPPYGKRHIIAFASITFFLGIGLLFYFKSQLISDLLDKNNTHVTTKTTDAATLRKDFPEAVNQLDQGNSTGALVTSKMQVFDIRPATEYNQGHIAGSFNIEIGDLKNASLMDNTTIVIYGQDQKVIQQAVEALKSKKIASIQILTGSIDELKKQGYTINAESLWSYPQLTSLSLSSNHKQYC